jgi:predicted MFS family arabinose efflux permease
VALGYLIGVVPVVVGLFLVGFANGAWDVAMNVQGASVEQHLGRSIMSRYHAGFSLGTVAGAGVGAVMVLTSVSVTVHLSVVAIGTAIVVPLAVRGFLPDVDDTPDEGAEKVDRGSVFRRWLEPRTLLIGVFVFAFAFAEGTGNDWIAVSLIDGYQTSAAAGTVGFAVFLTAMTAGRWFGPNLLDRYGRVAVVRTLAVVATGGLLVFIFSPSTPLAFVGIALWGVGTSLGFPVGMSAAADDPAAAAGRVSVVASIGYCAFLAGPPLIGFLGEQASVLKALTVVAGLLAVAAVVAAALRPLPTAGRPRPAESAGGGES